MKYALWTVQILLAAAFLMSGSMKLITPTAELAAQMPWVESVPAFAPKLAGLAEVLASFGLILPAALRIKPGLTPAAALGLVTVMVLAIGVHAMRGEWPMVMTNVVLASLAGFVAWGRTKKLPITERRAHNTTAAAAA